MEFIHSLFEIPSYTLFDFQTQTKKQIWIANNKKNLKKSTN